MKKLLLVFSIFCSFSITAQLIEVPAGSIIINMGVTPQTVNNALKPYGLVYELVSEYHTPVSWVFSENKSSMGGNDFIYKGQTYKGGCFIILKENVNATVEGRCFTWSIDYNNGGTDKVTYEVTTEPFYVNEFVEIASVPLWAINSENASITQGYLAAAGIPSSNFPIVDPALLDECYDAFMMAHSDPTWATHKNILKFLAPTSQGGYGGWLWAGCHAVSVLEGLSGNEYSDFGTYVASGSSNWTSPGNVSGVNDGVTTQRSAASNFLLVEFPNTVPAGNEVYIFAKNTNNGSNGNLSVQSGVGVIDNTTSWSSASSVAIPKKTNAIEFFKYTVPAGGADGIRISSNLNEVEIDAVASSFIIKKMNFLSDPTLVNFNNHIKGDNVIAGYGYDNTIWYHPFAQFMDDLVPGTKGGSEQHYVPGAISTATGGPAKWRDQTTVASYNPNFADNPGTNPVSQQESTAKFAWGRAFGNPDWGMIMYEAGHEFKTSEGLAYISGLRAYLNFSILSGIDEPIIVDPGSTSIPDQMVDGVASPITVSATNATSYKWECDCPGTFAPNANTATATFTPNASMSAGDQPIDCIMRAILKDACGKEYSHTESFIITHPTISNPVAEDDNVDKFSYEELKVKYLSNDYDPNNDPLTTTLLVAGGEPGIWTDNGDGTVVFTPTNPSANNYTATTTYKICKTSSPASCDNATITLTVIPNNCSPGEAPEILSNISYANSVSSSSNFTAASSVLGAPDGVLAKPGAGAHELVLEIDLSGPTNTPITFLPADSTIVFKVRSTNVVQGIYATAQSNTGSWDNPGNIVGDPSLGTTAKNKAVGAEIILTIGTGVAPAGTVIEIFAKTKKKDKLHEFTISSATTLGSWGSPQVNSLTPSDNDADVSFFYTVPAGGAQYLRFYNIGWVNKDVDFQFYGIKYDKPLPIVINSFDVKASPSSTVPNAAGWSAITNTVTVQLFSDGGIQNVNYTVPTGGAKWLQITNSTNDGVFGFDGLTFNAGDVVCSNAVPNAESDILTTGLNTPIDIDMDDYVTHPTGIASIDWSTFDFITDVGNGTVDTTGFYLDRIISYTPNSGFLGLDFFKYQIEDLNGDLDSNIIAIAVLEPPVTIHDYLYVDKDNNNSPTGNLLTNDFGVTDLDFELTSIEGTPMVPSGLTGISTTQGGTVDVDENGDFTYTPPSGAFTGDDDFSYTICDLSGICHTGKAVITVNTFGPTPNPPHASNDNTWVLEGESITLDVIGNDDDIDGDLNVSSIAPISGPSFGAVVYNADGTITYTPTPGYIGDDSFVYKICDLQPICDSAKVSIEVLPGENVLVNVMPNAIDDYNVVEGITQVGGNILTNDSDRDGDDITLSSVNGTSIIGQTAVNTPNGTITIEPDGSYFYVADNGFFGTDVFSYSVCDVELLCSEATIYIQVTDCEIDTDGDGVVNCDDVDDDNDGIKDVDEGFIVDSDGDGVPNYLDLDSDGDGIADVIEAGGEDPDNDGVIGIGPITDLDGDGLEDEVDNHDGGAGGIEVINGTPLPDFDTDSDGVQNRIDIDADNDGIADVIEAQGTFDYIAPSGIDADLDGIDDAFDTDYGGELISPIDFDGDTTPDYIDLDTDGDALSDVTEANQGTISTPFTDTDGDGMDDAFDLVDGNSEIPPASGTNVDNGGQLAANPFPINGNYPVLWPEPDWRDAGMLWWSGLQWYRDAIPLGSTITPPGSGDDSDRSVYVTHYEGTVDPVMVNSATVRNLYVLNNVFATVKGACLEVTNIASNEGHIKFESVSETSYGQYLGPRLDSITFGMVLNENGWHNIAAPVSSLASDFVKDNADNDGNRAVVSLIGGTGQNLFWWDPMTSGGKEIGFKISRNAVNYSSHAYGTWMPVVSGDTMMKRGYNMFINESFYGAATPREVVMTGSAIASEMTYLTHNNFGGWNLIPNPYPVTIDVDAMDGVGGLFDPDGNGTYDYDRAVWIWDPGDNAPPGGGTVVSGAYSVYSIDAATSLVNGFPALGTSAQYVAPFQSFYIRKVDASLIRRKDVDGANPGEPNDPVAVGSPIDPAVTANPGMVTLKPSYRSSCISTKHYKTNFMGEIIILKVSDQVNTAVDMLELAFDSKYTNDYDAGYDIIKQANINDDIPEMFTVLNGIPLVMNKMAIPTKTSSVPVMFYSEIDSREFTIDLEQFPTGWSVYIEDKLKGGAWHNLTNSGYTFKNNPMFDIERFVLHFAPSGVEIEGLFSPSIGAYGIEEGIVVEFSNIKDKSAEILITDLSGHILHSESNVSTEQDFIYPAQNSVPQVYIIRAITDDITENIKIVR